MRVLQRCLRILVLGAVLALPCRAGDDVEAPMLLTSETSEQLMETGRRHLVNFQLYDAERTFRHLMQRPDGEAAARYFLAKSSFLKALVTDEQVYFDEYYERADSLLAYLDGIPASSWRQYLRAETYLYRAVSEGKREHLIRAAFSARKAYKLFASIIEDDPAFYDAYVGMGVLHLLIGSLPGTYRTVLKVLGYGGDVEQGLDELEAAASRSRLSRFEARTYLALTDILLNHSEKGGLETLAVLYDTYPESALCAHLYGFALLANRRAAEAERLLRSAIRAGQSADYFYIDYADFYLAQALFRQNRYAEAEPFYRHYLKRHRGPALRALARVELGLTLEMLGRRDEALAVYRQVEQERAFDTDAWSYRTAQERMQAPMTPLERTLLLACNAYDAGHYAEAEALLLDVFNVPEVGADARAEAGFRLGRVYQAQGRLAEAREAFAFVLAQPSPDPQARWGPWSQFYLGEIHARHGQRQRAIAAFEAALAYGGSFDYRQSLEQQAKAALGRLRDGG